MKKLGVSFTFLLGALINVFAGEGIVLYKGLSPNGEFMQVYIDAKDEYGNPGQDGIEDTILVLGGSELDYSIERRVTPVEGRPPVVISFDDRYVEHSSNGFDYITLYALHTINGKSARPNQGR